MDEKGSSRRKRKTVRLIYRKDPAKWDSMRA